MVPVHYHIVYANHIRNNTHPMRLFVKGTGPGSGIALLASALKTFSSIGCKVLCTTHFLEIFSMDLIRNGESGFSALQMKVHVPESTNGTATPLFQLEVGVATSSAGLVCAQMAGVKTAVIDRAREIVEAIKQGRKVDPLTEILRNELELSNVAKELVGQYVKGNWNEASDEEVLFFREKTRTLLKSM
jgi:DNA mismatch repair ATPase MutS